MFCLTNLVLGANSIQFKLYNQTNTVIELVTNTEVLLAVFTALNKLVLRLQHGIYFRVCQMDTSILKKVLGP